MSWDKTLIVVRLSSSLVDGATKYNHSFYFTCLEFSKWKLIDAYEKFSSRDVSSRIQDETRQALEKLSDNISLPDDGDEFKLTQVLTCKSKNDGAEYMVIFTIRLERTNLIEV